jgi:hypothetical protein
VKNIKPGQTVTINDGRGNKVTGTVQRVWGTRAVNVTVRTDEDKPRTFVRLAENVER